jgi:hypothetical protein
MLRVPLHLCPSDRVAQILTGVAVIALGLPFVARAEDDVRAPRPLEIWLETLVQAARTHDVKWDSILLAPPPKSDAPKHTARVEITSTERFSRLSRLLDFRAGTADMKDLSSGATKRRQVNFELNVSPRAATEKASPVAAAVNAVHARLAANPGVTIQHLLLLRPLEMREGNHDRLQVPLDLRITGEVAQLLTLVHELPGTYPGVTPVSLRIEHEGTRGTLDARLHLLTQGLSEATALPDEKSARDQIMHHLASIPSLQLSFNPASVGWQVRLQAPLSTAPAGKFLAAALSIPSLVSFDVLGFQHAALSGLLFIKGP